MHNHWRQTHHLDDNENQCDTKFLPYENLKTDYKKLVLTGPEKCFLIKKFTILTRLNCYLKVILLTHELVIC